MAFVLASWKAAIIVLLAEYIGWAESFIFSMEMPVDNMAIMPITTNISMRVNACLELRIT